MRHRLRITYCLSKTASRSMKKLAPSSLATNHAIRQSIQDNRKIIVSNLKRVKEAVATKVVISATGPFYDTGHYVPKSWLLRTVEMCLHKKEKFEGSVWGVMHHCQKPTQVQQSGRSLVLPVTPETQTDNRVSLRPMGWAK